MLSLKRKHDILEDSEEEEEPSYGKQILPVANLPADFDDEPTDGMQYLFMVRRAARQLPNVLRVPNPFATQESSSVAIRIDNSEHAGDLNLPSEEWRELFEYRFLNFRKNFNQPTIHVGPTSDGSRRLMPEKKDRDMWWAFLEGKPEAEWTPVQKSNGKSKNQVTRGLRAWADEPPRQQEPDNPIYELSPNNDEGEVEEVLKMDPADSLPSPAGTPVLPLEYLEDVMQPSSTTPCICKPREPTTQLLKLINGKTALHLLMYFTHWMQLYLKSTELDNHVPTESHARWIFALLSRVDDQISADDMNLLRNLARTCLELLTNIKANPFSSSSLTEKSSTQRMGETSCWLVVTLIADVWKQRDLWIDAETILNCRRLASK